MKEIKIRRSVRSFKDTMVEDTLIDLVLRAGMNAPSAANQQPWEFLVLKASEDKKTIAMMSDLTRSAEKAPINILLLKRTDNLKMPELAALDISMCAQNIMLEAVHLGLGSVYLAVAPYQNRIDKLSAYFNLPEYIEPFGVIALGYPTWDKLNHEMDRYKEERIHWEKY